MVSTGVTISGATRVISNLNTVRSYLKAGDGWVVGVGADYGAYVEFGTSRAPPYPYLFPAAKTVMERHFERIEQEADSLDELVEELALAIETEAKRNASGRPGPNVITGYLRDSIEAAPAGKF